MTEPSLLTAFVPMQATAYARWLRGPAGQSFAEAAASIIVNGHEDYLILRYLKSEQAVYLAYVFRWADQPEDIMERPYFKDLLGASSLMEVGARGRILISPGAMNFLADGVEAAFTLTHDGPLRDDICPQAELAQFDDLLNTHVFGVNIGEAPYQDAVRNPRILDPKLRKKVDALLEAHRQKVALERLPQATPLHPVRLFDRYHYNGHFVMFAYQGAIKPVPELDAATCRQQSWGASDASHVAIGGCVIATPPEKFKAYRFGEDLCFFTDGSSIYGPDFKPIAGSDPKTFKLVKARYARDRSHWYTWKGDVLSDVGDDGTVNDALYFLDFTLLIGSTSIYFGRKRLPLDAASTVVKHIIKRPAGPVAGLISAWFSDKDGDLIVHGYSQSVDELQVVRTTDPDALWKKLGEMPVSPPDSPRRDALRAIRSATSETIASDDIKALTEYRHYFETWIAAYGGEFTGPHRYEYEFWSAINNYFYYCWHLKQPDKIIRYYDSVKSNAWWHPDVFHHTACAFVAVGDLDTAMTEVRRALVYGYDKVDSLLSDPDIAVLAKRDDFTKLVVYRQQNKDTRTPFLPLELVVHLANLDMDELTRRRLMDRLESRFYVPNDAVISAGFEGRPEDGQRYKTALSKLVNDLATKLLDAGSGFQAFHKIYTATSDLDELSPPAHLFGALALYREGLFWVDMKADDSEPRPEFAGAIAALRRMRAALANHLAYADEPAWRALERSAIAGPFIAMANNLAL